MSWKLKLLLGLGVIIFSVVGIAGSYSGVFLVNPLIFTLLVPVYMFLILISWLRSRRMNWKWKFTLGVGIVILAFSICTFAWLLLYPPWQHPQVSRQTPALIGVFSLALGVALIALALLRRDRANMNRLRTIAGTLALAAACICGFLGISFIGLAINPPPYMPSPGQSPSPPWRPYPLLVVFGLLGFGAGAGAGILILREKMFWLAAVGTALMLPKSVVLHMLSAAAGWGLGTPIILLAALSMIFTARSKREFTS